MEDKLKTKNEKKNDEKNKKEEDNIENIENIENIDNLKDMISRDSYSTNKDSQNEIKKEKISSDINYDNLLLKNKNYKIEILDEHIKKYDLNFKIIIIGNIGVGKSCLSLKATKGIFTEEYTSTVGFEFYCFNVKINDKIVKLQIWDTCGQEAYRSLIQNFYRNASLAIVVYSIEDKNSFDSSCKIFLIGNKIDSDFREVSYEQGLKCKNDFFFDCFMETSAKEGINTRELFVNAATVLYEENKNLIEEIGVENSSDSDSLRFSLGKEEKYLEDVDQCIC